MLNAQCVEIEYGNYCWHCNECTSIFPFIGTNDTEFIDENVAYTNSYDLWTAHEKLTEFSDRSFQYLDDGQHDVQNILNPESYAGETVYDVYDTLQADDDDCAAIKNKLSVHIKPVKLTHYRVYTFRTTEQLTNEILDGFATHLRTLAKD